MLAVAREFNYSETTFVSSAGNFSKQWAAGPRAAYLVSRGILPQNKSLIIEQGYEIRRPSRIEALVSGDEIKVGGQSVTIAEETIKI